MGLPKEEKLINISSELIDCSFCSESFSHQTQLLFHHENVHADKLHFACSLCKQKFAAISLLSDHVSKHNIPSIFKCSKCSKSFTSPIGLVKHKCNAALICSKLINGNDSRKLPSISNINIEKLQSHLNDQPLRWDTQTDHLEQLPDIKVVLFEKHEVPNTWCGSDFQGNIRKNTILDNLRISEINLNLIKSEIQTTDVLVEETNFKPMLLPEDKLIERDESCDLLNVKSDVNERPTGVSSASSDTTEPWGDDANSYYASSHDTEKSINSLNINNNKKTFACEQCDKILNSKAAFNMHHKKAHVSEQLMKYKCRHCDESFPLKRLLNRHIKTTHTVERKRTYQCTQCEKSFFNKQNLEHHTPTHSSERLTCVDCKKQFCGARALNRHKLIHTTELNYVCRQCEKRFARSSDLSSHVLKQHRQMGPFVCSQCNKSFSVLSNLNAHVRRMHSEGCGFLCMHCAARYTTKSSLNNHLVVHGELTHTCTVCDKKFIRLHSLKYHVEQMHCDTKPSFLCPLCGKGFTKKSNLNYHILIHTGERRYACTNCDKRFTKPHDMKIHIRRVHGNVRPFECAPCKKIFATKGQLKVHKMLHCSGEGYSCSHCDQIFPFLSALTRHVKQEHDT